MSDDTPDTGSSDAPTNTDTTAPPPDNGGPDVSELQRELEKYKALHRKQEERAKANAKAAEELDKLRKASMSDQEKAVEQARAEARAETLRTVGSRLVDAELKATVAGRLPAEQLEALLERLDRSHFLTDDGAPDTKAITAWVDRIAPAGQHNDTAAPRRPLDMGQGRRPGTAQPSVASGAALYAAKHGKQQT